MSKFEKLIKKLETNPKDVSFNDLDKILISLGYERRNKGTSHFVYRKKNAPTQTCLSKNLC